MTPRLLAYLLFVAPLGLLSAQSAGSAGTISGTVTDPSGAVIPGANVMLSNQVSGFRRTTKTEPDGSFVLQNIPPNPYHLQVDAPGFNPTEQDVVVRSSVPVSLKIPLKVASERTEVRVEAVGADLVETIP